MSILKTSKMIPQTKINRPIKITDVLYFPQTIIEYRTLINREL